MNIKETMAVINAMQRDAVIDCYAVGGAVAATFYLVEPDMTEDVDVYIILNPNPGEVLVSLEPVHRYLETRGYQLNRKGDPIVAGWPVQFLPADRPLLKEALETGVEKEVDGVTVRVFTVEHLAAIAFQLGRPKDKVRLFRLLDSPDFNERQFSEILARHDLIDRWAIFKKQMLG